MSAPDSLMAVCPVEKRRERRDGCLGDFKQRIVNLAINE